VVVSGVMSTVEARSCLAPRASALIRSDVDPPPSVGKTLELRDQDLLTLEASIGRLTNATDVPRYAMVMAGPRKINWPLTYHNNANASCSTEASFEAIFPGVVAMYHRTTNLPSSRSATILG
jgi:hypothetical protein